ncbi:hypothetical protein ES705_36273 [subsurface metagenome]
MRIFGLIIQREKGTRVGSLESAIIDLQARVNVLEHNQKVKVKEAGHEQAEQSDVATILAGGPTQDVPDLWDRR